MADSGLGQNTIVILTERSKVLKSPARFIGSVETREVEKMVVTPDLKSVEEKLLRFNPGLFKVMEEVFDNALDECKRHDLAGRKPNLGDEIRFNVDKDCQWITISDNGNGIPTRKAKLEDGSDSDMTMYQAAWTKLGAGTNFDGFTDDDSQARGQNGEGVTLTNIFSKEFRGYTQHKDTFVSVICKDNMETIDIKEEHAPGRKSGTTVQFLLDYERFGETHLTQDHQLLIMYYFAILSIQNPHVKFFFQDVQIKFTMDNLIEGITRGKKAEYEMLKVNGLTVIVLQSNNYKFKQYINGSDADGGGNPIEWVTKKVVEGYLKALPKKYNETIKPGNVESKLQVIALFDGMIKPRFEGQTKNKCITPYAQFSKTIDEKALDWKEFGTKLYKNKKISQNILLYHELELTMLQRKSQEKVEKDRKGISKIAKYEPATQKNDYLIIAEGDSAINGIMKVLDKKTKGFFPVRGKTINVYKNSKKRAAANDELKQLFSQKVLNLSFTEENKDMNYKTFVIGADADMDGIHIVGLYLGLMNYTAQKMLIDGRVKMLQTPTVMCKNKKTDKTEKIFFTQYEYDKYVKNNPKEAKALYHDYKKGLSSLNEKEWKELFDAYTFEDLLVTLKLRDPETDPDGYNEDMFFLTNWMSEDSSFRKYSIVKYLDFVLEEEKLLEHVNRLSVYLTDEDGNEFETPNLEE